MKKAIVALVTAIVWVGSLSGPSVAQDRPFSTARLKLSKLWYPQLGADGATGLSDPGGPFSKVRIERFRCTSSGDPTATVDISCNDATYGQDWAPDNEIAIAVNPTNPNHLVAGSNDYYYRFNNATGARQAIVPTGFFTSFDGGATWTDGQIPTRSGSGAGDPAPAFVVEPRAPGTQGTRVLMAQLENAGGLGGANLTQGDVSVSHSPDGLTWSEPVTVMKGHGNANVANQAKFYDKEWITCNNVEGTTYYGRCWITSTLFLNGIQGAYVSSDIFVSWSDDGGLTWSEPRSLAAQHPSCSYQENGPAGACDENQFSIPEVGADGALYIHFMNSQNEAEWEAPFDFDSQIMVMKSANGSGEPDSFTGPFQVAQLEDGLTDMPFSVISRQTVWGHQLRWTSAGTITADPTDPNHITAVYSDRGTPNPNIPDPQCFFSLPGDAPTYDPCNAGPGSDTNVYRSDSLDGGRTWTQRTLVDAAAGRHQWFPWADYKPTGELAIAWDEDIQPDGQPYVPKTSPPNDAFIHQLWVDGTKEALTPTTGTAPSEQIDISATHWGGQYVPPALWPAVCGPMPYSDRPITDAEGKDCNVFHGDYTGLATDSLGRVHVVWTGLNRLVTTPQIDPYTGARHDGYAQDAMYARR
jgi:hypothetical protein